MSDIRFSSVRKFLFLYFKNQNRISIESETLFTDFFTLEKLRHFFFLKIKVRGPQVQDMPSHELEVITLPIITSEPISDIKAVRVLYIVY